MVTIKVKGGPQRLRRAVPDMQLRAHHQGIPCYREEVYCRYFYLEHEIHFPVSECTFYEDRRLASKREMEEIAWILRTDMPRRRVGFISSEQLQELEAEAAVLPARFGRDEAGGVSGGLAPRNGRVRLPILEKNLDARFLFVPSAGRRHSKIRWRGANRPLTPAESGHSTKRRCQLRIPALLNLPSRWPQ